MEQIVDLQSDGQFQELGLQLVNITMDSAALQEEQAQYSGWFHSHEVMPSKAKA